MKNRINQGHYRDKRGFTLIELLVVMVILGLLAALVGPKLFGKVKKGRQTAAKIQIELFGQALDSYWLDTGSYPTTSEGLHALLTNTGVEGWDGPYLKKSVVPNDPWNNPYQYQAPGTHGDYDLIAYGADKAPGGEGENRDIISWE